MENCRIPLANLLLGPGGFKKQISGFNVERLGNASRSLALGRLCYNLAREHVLIRKQFGRPLCEFQGIQWKFADMALKLEIGAAAAVQGRDGRRAGPAQRAQHGAWPSWPATRPAGTSPTRRCRPWEAWATVASPSSNTAFAASAAG